MNLPFESTPEILDRHVCGFRAYRCGDTVRPTFISRNFCDMLGYTKEELESCSFEQLCEMVFPGDRPLFAALFDQIRKTRAAASAEYRIIRKDGSHLYVRDSVSVGEGADGTLTLYSVLNDITAVKTENENHEYKQP